MKSVFYYFFATSSLIMEGTFTHLGSLNVSMKQCMIFGFVKVNNLLIIGYQFGPHPLSEKHNFISATKDTTSSVTNKC